MPTRSAQVRPWWVVAAVAILGACTPAPDAGPAPDACADSDADALLPCSVPTLAPDDYVTAALAYFDTMDSRVPLSYPAYSPLVVRWEWPPWLKLTAYTREVIEASDFVLRLTLPSIVEARDCRAFDVAPFARCRVSFFYDEHDGLGCPIYEEFAFNESGEITWIEAWSDQPDLLPLDAATDPWAEAPGFPRLADRIPGLGSPTGLIDPEGDAMQTAAADDPDVADFVARAADFTGAWADEFAAAGDDLWAVGCGW